MTDEMGNSCIYFVRNFRSPVTYQRTEILKAVHPNFDSPPRAIPEQLAPARRSCGTLSSYLPLLPSGPGGVQQFQVAQDPAFIATCPGQPQKDRASAPEFSPAIADCGFRAPLTPHLARP